MDIVVEKLKVGDRLWSNTDENRWPTWFIDRHGPGEIPLVYKRQSPHTSDHIEVEYIDNQGRKRTACINPRDLLPAKVCPMR